jgi:hypothetical protein
MWQYPKKVNEPLVYVDQFHKATLECRNIACELLTIFEGD